MTIDATTNLTDYLVGDTYTFHDADSISVAANAVIAGGSRGITFSAPSITIGNNARITTTGSVSLTAKKTYVDVPQLTMWNQVLTVVEAIAGTRAEVTIGANAKFEVGSFTISTTAGDDSSGIGKATGITGIGQFVSAALQYVNDLTSLPLSGQVKQPSSSVTIGAGVDIVSAGDVTITTAATADATGQAVYSICADYLVKEKAGWQKDGSYGFGIAAGFSYVDASAETTLADGATISAAGNVSITASVSGTASMSSRTTLNQGNQQTNPNNIEVAYAGTYLDSVSRITVAAGSEITADAAVTIAASTKNKNKVKANTASYRDGLAGVTIGTGFGFGTAEVIVNGHITAGVVAQPADLAFHPLLAIDYAKNMIVFDAPVTFRTGDAVRYDTARGGAIPGLESGVEYFAIVAEPTRLGLAHTLDDALAGRGIDFGAGFPTLQNVTQAGSALPVTRVDAAANTIRFDMTAWPDGTPLFVDGDRATFKARPGQFLGRNAGSGAVTPLPDGNYYVRVLPQAADQIGMAIQLFDPETSEVIDLNDNPQMRAADGRVFQIASFDADSGQISFNFPQPADPGTAAPYPAPVQTVDLANGQPITYVAALGCHVPGLVDGRTYFAIVDPATPGLIRLADTPEQAEAADPVRQRAVPTLTVGGRTISIDNIEPGTGLVFGTDPGIPAGTAVVYHAVAGKPVAGLVDGTTYYAQPIANPASSADWPQSILGLRATADPSAPLLDLSLPQSLSAGGVDYRIAGVDTAAGMLAVALPGRIQAQVASGSLVVGPVAAGSLQAMTTATGGTFRIVLPRPDDAAGVATAALPFNASASDILQAINTAAGAAGLAASIQVTSAFGRGTREQPWTLVGAGLDDLVIDDDALVGGAAFSRLTPSDLLAISSSGQSASQGGTFTLALTGDVGFTATTAPIATNATAADVRAAITAVGGIAVDTVTGSGVSDDPWLVTMHRQPLETGDAVVFRDGWGSTSHGLIDGRTYYVVLGPSAAQGKAGAVVLGLVASREAALAASPVLLPLVSEVEFSTPDLWFPSGTRHTLAASRRGTGIDITATLSSSDSTSLKSANGSEPKLKDLLTRGDFAYKPGNWSGVAKNIFDWTSKDDKGKGTNSPLASQIEKLVGKQADGKSAVNEWLTVSASAASLKIDNTARVVIGSSAKLVTPGSVHLASTITESIQSNVEGTVSKPGKGDLGVALAVDVVQVWNTARTIVQADAEITGGAGVTVDSQVVYPWAGQMTIADPSDADDWKEYFEDDTMKFLSTLIGGKLGVDQWFVNHWSNVGIKQNAAEKPIDKAIAGSVAWVGFVNDATAWIEEGARVNVAPGVVASGGQPVSVTAAVDVAQTGFTGTVYLDLSPDAISKKIRRGEEFFNSQVVLEQGKNSYGGSVGAVEIQNTARALVGGLETETVAGVTRPIRTPSGPMQVTAGSDGLTIDAANSLLLVQIGQAGGNAASTGFSGTASVLDARNDGRRQVVEAGIVEDTQNRRAAITSAGGVNVAAADTSYLIPVAGAVLISGNKGVGASTALALLDRDVTARVGGRDEKVAAGPLDVTAGGGITVQATADGAITPSALAAAIASNVEAKGDAKAAPNKANSKVDPIDISDAKGATGHWGLAISGDYAQATIDDAVRAMVHLDGTVRTQAAGSKLLVSAVNTSLVQVTAGAASWNSAGENGSSFGLAGSGAVITGSSKVTASIGSGGLEDLAGDLIARNARRLGSLAAGGAGSRTGSGMSIDLLGSVTVVDTTATTAATIASAASKRGTAAADSLAGLSLTATTDDTVWSVAGSFLAGFSLKPSEKPGAEPAQAGTNVGIGTAVAVHTITTTTTATVTDSTLGLASGDISLEARDTTGVYAFAAGMSASSKGVSVDGMFTFVTIQSATTAAVDGGALSAAGTADVAATSAVLAVAATGDLILSRGSRGAVGAAVTSVKSTVSGTARVARGRVTARKGDLSVRSESRNPEPDTGIEALLDQLSTPNRGSNAVWAFAAGTIVSVDASRGSDQGSVVTTNLSPTIHASVTGSAVLEALDGSILVRASDAAGVYSGAGGIDADLGAVGAAVASNTLSPSVTSIVEVATLSAAGANAGKVTVDAVNSAVIDSAAAGVALAAKLGGGTSLVFNGIPYGEVRAQIRGQSGQSVTSSKVTATGDVVVTAADRSTVRALAGEVDGVGGGQAGGAAAATNTIHTAVDAAILIADITTSGGAITVDADAAATIDAYAVGVAGAWSGGEASVRFDGTGSGTGNTLTRHISSRVQRSTLTSKGLSITAEDRATISTAAGSLGIQKTGAATVSAAVGISASTNEIGSATSRGFVTAKLEDSQVTTHGDLHVEAQAKLDIEAITAAGAGDFSSGQSIVGFAGAGAGSGNTLYVDVEAAIRLSRVAQDTSGSVTVAATNTSQITAIAGGVEMAGRSTEEPAGVLVSVGAAAAVNDVGGSTKAVLDHTIISKALAVTVTADGSQGIEAVAAGVAGAVSTGAGSLFAFGGAGSGSGNAVSSDVLASITGSTIGTTNTSRVGPVSLGSTNGSSIVAGTGSLGVSFGLASMIGLSVGVSVSENRVTGSVQSVIETSAVFSSGDVSVTAHFTTGQDDHTIEAISVAGSGGVAKVASLAGAGAGVTNTVAVDTAAVVQSKAQVDATGSVILEATDEASIYANAGGTGLGLAWEGDVGGGVAVGAATATSAITGNVRAALEAATVNAGKAITIDAVSRRGVESIGFGVALDTTVARAGLSAAGSGAAVTATLGGSVEAAILSGSTKATGSVVLSATDAPTMQSGAGAGSLAATVGLGLALAPGVVTIDERITTGVTTRIATLSGGTAPSVTAGAAVELATKATASVDSTAVAVAAAAAIGEFDAALSGSGAHAAVTINRPVTSAIDSGSVTAASVAVATTNHHTIGNVVGSGAGAVGIIGGSIGVSLAESTVADQVTARIGAATVTAKAGDITIDASAAHAIATESVATALTVAIGGSGAGGHAFATDQSSVTATVQTGAVLAATKSLAVSAAAAPAGVAADTLKISAFAHGGSGGLATVGTAIGEATDTTARQASIGDSVDLSKVGSLAVRAEARPQLVGRSVAVDVGGVAVTVNQSTARSRGTLQAFTGSAVTLPGGDVSIVADATVALDVEQTGVTAAGLGFGATQSTAETALATKAWLGAGTKTADSRRGGLVVSARSHDLNHVKAVAGGGGILAGGIGTTGDIIDTTTTTASLMGGEVHAGAATVSADRTHDYDIDVESYPVSVGVSVGIASASLTTTGATVGTTVAGGTNLRTSGTTTLDASHVIRHQADAFTVDGVGFAVGGSGVQSRSTVTAPVLATIEVANGASIITGTDPLTARGGIVIVPTAELRVDDRLQLTNIGLLANGGRITSSVTGTVSPHVTIGDKATLVTYGDLDIGTVAIVDAAADIAAFGVALFGGTGGDATVNVQVDQQVTVGANAVLTADGTLSLTPGSDPTGSAATQLQLDAASRVKDLGVVGLPFSEGTSSLGHTVSLSVGGGTATKAGGDLLLTAETGNPSVTAIGLAEGDTLGIPTTGGTSKPSATATSTLALAGTFVAGREPSLSITIPNDKQGQPTATVQAKPSAIFGRSIASTYVYDSQFKPRDYIDQAGYDPATAEVLKQGVAAGPVGAIRFTQPLVVSGGSIYVAGDTVSATGATFTANVGQITIQNESPDYLVLGPTIIASVEGGKVEFRTGDGQTAATDPSGAAITRNPVRPQIRISQTYAGNVGGVSFGPAIFAGGQIENSGGLVSITNAKGSFGQSAQIAAQEIHIETPGGVLAVNTPTQDWSAAGTPADQAGGQSGLMHWPGGGRTNPNGNHAAMAAVNFLKSNGEQYNDTWTATSEEDLYYKLYGTKTEDRSKAYVFFGPTVPYWHYGHSDKGTVETLAKTVRPDGKAEVRLLGGYIKKDPDYGYLVTPQKIDHIYDGNFTVTPSQTPAIKAQVIVIHAKTVNINGTIEAQGATGDRSVRLDTALEKSLEEYQAAYRQGVAGKGPKKDRFYRIPTASLHVMQTGDSLIEATFDADTGRIVLDEATSGGSSRVSITGQIINTAPSSSSASPGGLPGRIHVAGGAGRVAVQNDTSFVLEVSGLHAGASDGRATISITDTLVSDAARQQTLWVHDGTGIKVYHGPVGHDLSGGVPAQTISGTTTTYDPMQHARWQWQLAATLTRSVTGDTSNGYSASDWSFHNPSNPWSHTGTDTVVTDSISATFRQEFSAVAKNMLAGPYMGYQSNRGAWDSKHNPNISYDRQFYFPQQIDITMTNSLKADYPIGIDFTGSSTAAAGVFVTSKGGVVLAGIAEAPHVSLIVNGSGSSLTAGLRGRVAAGSVTLEAAGAIGGVLPVVVAADTLSATSTTAGIHLVVNRDQPLRSIEIAKLQAEHGGVKIRSGGSIRGKPGGWQYGGKAVDVVTATLVVESLEGSINLSIAPPTGSGATELDASGARAILIDQVVGDLVVRGAHQTQTHFIATVATVDSRRSFRKETIVSSPNGRFRLVMQTDGNCVLYDYSETPHRPVWASKTHQTATKGDTAKFSDGEFAVYDSAGKAVFSTDTAGHPDYGMLISDDGWFGIVDRHGEFKWTGHEGSLATQADVAAAAFDASVVLSAAGNIVAAAATGDSAADQARTAAYVRIGALDPTAYRRDVTAFEQHVAGRYEALWKLRGSGAIESGRLRLSESAVPLWRASAEQARLFAGRDPFPEILSAEQVAEVIDHAAALYEHITAFFDEALPAGWRDTVAFQEYRGVGHLPAADRFRLVASPEQVARFKAARPSLTAGQLAVRIPATAFIETTTADLTAGGPAAISGGRVSLLAGGSVGKVDAPLTISGDAIRSGDLTPAQLAELLLAGLPGDATRSLNADGTLASVTLTVRRPLRLAVHESLWAYADAGDVAVVQVRGELPVGAIAAAGQVHVVAEGTITRLNADTEIIGRVPAAGTTEPTVRLFSLLGHVGRKGEELKITGRLEAVAPQGEIHTNPPPAARVSLARVTGMLPDGTPITNVFRLLLDGASSGHRFLFASRSQRTGKIRWTPRMPRAREGMNRIRVMQVNANGQRSEPVVIAFVLDRRPPRAPIVRLLAGAAGASRPGELVVRGIESGSRIEYSVNGAAWGETYAPVEGRNVVRVRQIDRAGNASRVTMVRFMMRPAVASRDDSTRVATT